MASDERIYFVVYDISDAKRWRAVYKKMKGYGEWVQLSVFQCRLSKTRQATVVSELSEIIHDGEDHVLFVDVGFADKVEPRVLSLGKRAYEPVEREAIIV